MDTPNDTKFCNGCQQHLPLTQFNKRSSTPSGLASKCKSCCADYCRQWYKNNADKQKEQSSKWYSEHREYATEWVKERRAENPEKFRQRDKERYSVNPDIKLRRNNEWAKANPGKVKARGHRARARKREAPGQFTAADIDQIRAGQTDKHGALRCWICGKPMTSYHIDHFIPLIKGGTNDAGNLRLACPKCNMSKGGKHPHELGRLL